MGPQREKDWLDTCIDFFFGAVGSDIVIALLFARIARGWWVIPWPKLWILLIAGAVIGGSLAALFRNEFWSGLEPKGLLPPMDEVAPRRARTVLWVTLALGCLTLGLLFVF